MVRTFRTKRVPESNTRRPVQTKQYGPQHCPKSTSRHGESTGKSATPENPTNQQPGLERAPLRSAAKRRQKHGSWCSVMVENLHFELNGLYSREQNTVDGIIYATLNFFMIVAYCC